jgi:hypothetical protein
MDDVIQVKIPGFRWEVRMWTKIMGEYEGMGGKISCRGKGPCLPLNSVTGTFLFDIGNLGISLNRNFLPKGPTAYIRLDEMPKLQWQTQPAG